MTFIILSHGRCVTCKIIWNPPQVEEENQGFVPNMSQSRAEQLSQLSCTPMEGWALAALLGSHTWLTNCQGLSAELSLMKATQ